MVDANPYAKDTYVSTSTTTRKRKDHEYRDALDPKDESTTANVEEHREEVTVTVSSIEETEQEPDDDDWLAALKDAESAHSDQLETTKEEEDEDDGEITHKGHTSDV